MVASAQLRSGHGSLWSGGHHAALQHMHAVDFLLLLSFEETQLIPPLLLLGFTTSRFVLLGFIIIVPVFKKTVSI